MYNYIISYDVPWPPNKTLLTSLWIWWTKRPLCEWAPKFHFLLNILKAWHEINYCNPLLMKLNTSTDKGVLSKRELYYTKHYFNFFFTHFFRLKSDGRITDISVNGIQKRYTPEKHYVFILKIVRENVKDHTYLFRTYKEFCELDAKLQSHFPLSGCHR